MVEKVLLHYVMEIPIAVKRNNNYLLQEKRLNYLIKVDLQSFKKTLQKRMMEIKQTLQ